MGKAHHLIERRQKIVEAIGKTDKLSVLELSEQFNVSEVTIRNDLQALNNQGFLLRTRGGAISTHKMHEFSFDVRQQKNAAQKARIAAAAAALVNYGDTIFIDASTTGHALIPHLKTYPELTVVTNSLKAALALLDAPQIQVVIPGGYLRRESISTVGLEFRKIASKFNIQIGFFGARGLSAKEGLTEVNMDEVVLKRDMVKRCRRVVAVLDADKWHNIAAHSFASLQQIDTIISDRNAPQDLVSRIRQSKVEIVLV